MHAATHVFYGMVYNLVLKFPVQAIIAWQRITVHRRTRFYLFLHSRLQRILLAVWQYFYADFSTPLAETHHRCLIVSGPSTLDYLLPLGFVHIASLSTNEGFINFDLSIELYEVLGVHCLANSVKHEPSGFLGHTKGTRHFIGAD